MSRRRTAEPLPNDLPDAPPIGLRNRRGLWMLRLLVEGGGTALSRRSPSLRRAVSSVFDNLIDDDFCDRSRSRSEEARTKAEALIRWRRQLEARAPRLEAATARNLRWLGQRLELAPLECEIVGFVSYLESDLPLREAFETFTPWTAPKVHQAVAAALGVEPAAIAAALRPAGALARCRLLSVSLRHKYHDIPFRLLDSLANSVLMSAASSREFFGNFLRPTPPVSLAIADFGHVAADVDLLRRFLGAALDRGTKGINILLHGAPGTGKTELARTLARACRARPFDAVVENADGESIGGSERLDRAAFCQALLARTPRAVMIFDELEDAFPRGAGAFLHFLAGRGVAANGKGWVNNLLESNPVPTIWMGNAIGQIDTAFLRRFDFVVELRTPPARVRRAILESATRELPLRDEFLARTAADDRLRPSDVIRAARVVDHVAPKSPEEAERLVSRTLAAGFDAEGLRRPRVGGHGELGGYDLRFVNASLDPAKVVSALARAGSGSVLLSGPPGTGKTAFASHLAARLERPLHARRASDLLSKWVGQTEANLAEAFRSAEAEGAVLFLDEADSFFHDRRRAQASWEVTQVNELLQQVESFPGVFACATNLVEELDPAAIRRFAFKVRFDPLTFGQRVEILRQSLVSLGVTSPGAEELEPWMAKIRNLEGLTAGDAAAVVRRFRLTGDPAGPGELLEGFAEECVLKPAGKRRAGFGFGASEETKGER